MQGLVVILCLLPAATAHRLREDPPAQESDVSYAKSECEKLCKEDAGMDGDPTDCLTECAVYTDLNNHGGDDNYGHPDALEDFATDEAYNEVGGEKMADEYEEMYGQEIANCAPSVDVDGPPPKMKDLDEDGDGSVTKLEAEDYGKKACIPDEMTDQIFEEADADQDHKISEGEFDDAGEDTVAEESIDESMEGKDGPFTGDDESAVVQAAPFEDLDKNQDTELDADEMKSAMHLEAEKRTESNTAHMPPNATDKELVAEADPVEEVVDKIDTNGDGTVSQTEYEAEGDGGSDYGEEMQEASKAKEDKFEDPDDLSRVESKPAELLSTNFRKAQTKEAAFLGKFSAVEPRTRFVGLQRGEQRGKARQGFGQALAAAMQQHHAAMRQHLSQHQRHRSIMRHQRRQHRN